jgi:hypothetical protein
MTAFLLLATLPAPVLLAFGAVVAGACFWAGFWLRRGLS